MVCPSHSSKLRLKNTLVLFCGLHTMCIPQGCSSFYQPPLITFTSTKPSKQQYPTRGSWPTVTYSTTSSDADQSIFDMSVWEGDEDTQQSQGDSNVGLELWLDLRGTSLTPKSALELWHMEGSQNDQNQQLDNDDKMILLPKSPFLKCLVSSADDIPAHNDDRFDQNIDILIVNESEDGDTMTPIYQHTNHSPISLTAENLVGRILSLQTSSSMPVLPDPLPAMDVISKGQWVILDTEGWKKLGEEERLSMVLPLMELITSGASTGGVGLTCHTNNDLVKAAMFIQNMTNSGGGGGVTRRTKTLESGIVIPDDTNGSISSGKMVPRFAIIVPYDMGLLRSYCLLTEKCEHSNS